MDHHYNNEHHASDISPARIEETKASATSINSIEATDDFYSDDVIIGDRNHQYRRYKRLN